MKSYDYPEFGITVMHNPDFSGMLTICGDSDKMNMTMVHNAFADGRAVCQVELPAAFIKALAKESFKDDLTSLLEQL